MKIIILIDNTISDCIMILNSSAIQLLSEYDICLSTVKMNGFALQFIEHQTPEICLTAVQNNPYALQFVKEQTHDICMAAVQCNGYALDFVKEQTPELCIAAIKNNRNAVKYIRNQPFILEILFNYKLLM